MIDTLPNEQSSHTGITPLPSGSRHPLIIIVGENEDTRYMLRVILELWDYDVIEARNTEESFSISQDRKPSLILIDSTLQFRDSLNDLSKLRQSEEMGNTPSLIISGFSQENYRRTAIDRGASGFLVKPVDFDLLRQHIEMLVMQSHGH